MGNGRKDIQGNYIIVEVWKKTYTLTMIQAYINKAQQNRENCSCVDPRSVCIHGISLTHCLCRWHKGVGTKYALDDGKPRSAKSKRQVNQCTYRTQNAAGSYCEQGSCSYNYEQDL